MGMAPGPRFGVEEEFLVVDPDTGAAVPQAAAVVQAAACRLGSRVGGEITKLQVETRTDPCGTLHELHGQLVEGRELLAEGAARAGYCVAATGTPVLGDVVPPPITEGPRQDRGTALFRGLHDELAICALHVHVELPDRERAVLVGNHLRPRLPLLIALAANSPYWAERDTGYASWRTMIWTRWPVAGPPPYFACAEDYEATVAMLHEVGAVVDAGTLFWDIRPSQRFPTLEVRACDVPVTAEESAMLAALIRALAVVALRRVDAGDPGPAVPAETLRLAYWRAARDGAEGHGIDPLTGRPAPVADLVEQLLASIRPELEAAGELEFVSGWLKGVLEGCGGARSARRRGRRSHRAQIGGIDGNLAEARAPPGGQTGRRRRLETPVTETAAPETGRPTAADAAPRTVPLDLVRLTPRQMLVQAASFADRMARRRSVRDFSPEPVPDAVVEAAIRAAASAPSGANVQPWRFVVVADAERKRRLREAAEAEEYEFYHRRAPAEWLDAVAQFGTDWNKPFLQTAPLVIVVFEVHQGPNSPKPYYVKESVGIAVGILLAALHRAGLATLTHTPSPMRFLNEVCERPPEERPFLVVPVGYPAPDARVPDIARKSLDEVMVRR
ncbi:MAG TPA: glutamate--cysteine ligase [Actinocrinis sp.]